jgi:hypothetical protein
MSRATTRLLQQVISNLSPGGTGVSVTEVQTAESNSSAAEIICITGNFKVFGLGLTNLTGGNVKVQWFNSTSSEVVQFGRLSNGEFRFINFSPNYVVFDTNITLKKHVTGNTIWTILYI